MALKIAVIGGGSAYMPGLFSAMLAHQAVLGDAEIALMDIAQPELDIVHRLCRRMAECAGAALNVTAYSELEPAIASADFVLTTFRQGGFEARHEDESVPLRYGIIGQETIGPGGFFFAMRTLPVVRRITEVMQRHAPGALLLNYTNPTQIVAEAVTHFTPVPCISICDQSRDDARTIVEAMGLTGREVAYEAVGLNHATWSVRFTVDGEDGIELMDSHADAVLARDDVAPRTKHQFELACTYRRVPNSYMHYYYFREQMVAEALAKPTTRAQDILAVLPGYYRHYQEQAQAERPRITAGRGGSLFGDMAVDVLCSLIRQDGVFETLNVPNRGAIPGLAADRVVEVPARIEAAGGTPLAQDPLPASVMGLLHMLAEYQWLAADAIWNGDRAAVERALASNPLVLSLSTARALVSDFLALQGHYYAPNVLG